MALECRTAIPRPLSTYVTQCTCDTIAFHPDMLASLLSAYGKACLVMGSNYPLPAGLAHPVAEMQALGLAPDIAEAVLGGHASRLLRLTT